MQDLDAKTTKLQKAAENKADREDTEATKADDEKYLSDLTAQREQKASDFEARQKLRTEALEAIQKAIDIISGEAVSARRISTCPG